MNKSPLCTNCNNTSPHSPSMRNLSVSDHAFLSGMVLVSRSLSKVLWLQLYSPESQQASEPAALSCFLWHGKISRLAPSGLLSFPALVLWHRKVSWVAPSTGFLTVPPSFAGGPHEPGDLLQSPGPCCPHLTHPVCLLRPRCLF